MPLPDSEKCAFEQGNPWAELPHMLGMDIKNTISAGWADYLLAVRARMRYNKREPACLRFAGAPVAAYLRPTKGSNRRARFPAVQSGPAFRSNQIRK